MPEAPTPSDLGAVVDRLLAAGPALRALAVSERIVAIGRARERWLTQHSPWRRRAMDELPSITGYPWATIDLALDNLWRALDPAELHAAVRTEREPAGVPAALATHLLAGNVPGVGVFGMVAALLAGVPSLVKTAQREPLLPALIAASIAAEESRLGDALAVLHWQGGDAARDAVALAGAEVILAYGRGETLAAVAAHQPRRLLAFGERVSLGLVAAESVDLATARRAAFQVALFDQQGCLSPQVLVVEEVDPAATHRFAAELCGELGRLALALPRAPLTLAEATLVRRFLECQRWRQQEGMEVAVEADPAGRFGVVCDRSEAPLASPLNRHVVVLPVASLASAALRLRSLTGEIEAIGYAGPEHRLDEVAAVAAACGAHRLCPLERMQAPPFAWRQSGHARLACFFAPTAASPVEAAVSSQVAPG